MLYVTYVQGAAKPGGTGGTAPNFFSMMLYVTYVPGAAKPGGMAPDFFYMMHNVISDVCTINNVNANCDSIFCASQPLSASAAADMARVFQVIGRRRFIVTFTMLVSIQ